LAEDETARLVKAPSARSEARARQLVEAAAELFDKRGYHSTTIDDIGAALGITGPGIYRYFRGGKSVLLVDIFNSTIDPLLADSQQLLGEAGPPDTALRKLVALHIEFVLSHRSRMHVVRRETHSLPEVPRAAFRAKQRAYLDCWAEMLRRVRGDISKAQALVIVSGVVDMANHYARRVNEVSDDELRSIMAALCISGLLTPLRADEIDLGLSRLA
jgi:AcrR family transcriptional regulator